MIQKGKPEHGALDIWFCSDSMGFFCSFQYWFSHLYCFLWSSPSEPAFHTIPINSIFLFSLFCFFLSFLFFAAKSYLLDLLVLLHDNHRDRQTWTPTGVCGWWMFFFFLYLLWWGWLMNNKWQFCSWPLGSTLIRSTGNKPLRAISKRGFVWLCICIFAILIVYVCVCVFVCMYLCVRQSIKKVYWGVITEIWARCHWVYSSCSALIKLCLHE